MTRTNRRVDAATELPKRTGRDADDSARPPIRLVDVRVPIDPPINPLRERSDPNSLLDSTSPRTSDQPRPRDDARQRPRIPSSSPDKPLVSGRGKSMALLATNTPQRAFLLPPQGLPCRSNSPFGTETTTYRAFSTIESLAARQPRASMRSLPNGLLRLLGIHAFTSQPTVHVAKVTPKRDEPAVVSRNSATDLDRTRPVTIEPVINVPAATASDSPRTLSFDVAPRALSDVDSAIPAFDTPDLINTNELRSPHSPCGATRVRLSRPSTEQVGEVRQSSPSWRTIRQKQR